MAFSFILDSIRVLSCHYIDQMWWGVQEVHGDGRVVVELVALGLPCATSPMWFTSYCIEAGDLVYTQRIGDKKRDGRVMNITLFYYIINWIKAFTVTPKLFPEYPSKSNDSDFWLALYTCYLKKDGWLTSMKLQELFLNYNKSLFATVLVVSSGELLKAQKLVCCIICFHRHHLIALSFSLPTYSLK